MSQIKVRPYSVVRKSKLVYGPSVTVPDDCLSIQQLFQRYMVGQDLGNLRRPSFYTNTDDIDSPDFEKVRDLDLAERDEVVDEIVQRGKAAQSKVDAFKAEEDLKAKVDADELNEIKARHRVSKKVKTATKDGSAPFPKDKRSAEGGARD